MCNNTITKDPTIPQMCCYTNEMKCQCLKATMKNKTFLATNCKKLWQQETTVII